MNAAKDRMGPDEALDLIRESGKLVVAKGKKVSEFEPGGKAPKAVVDAMLGPTGNLRAPCLVVGKTVLVGFNQEAYEGIFP